jgi:hypothetical protein
MGKVKNLLERETHMASETATSPQIFGEVFDDGQMRGHYGVDTIPMGKGIVFGDYVIWDAGDNQFGIGYRETGEMGIFNKADFEAHIEAFYGLNF